MIAYLKAKLDSVNDANERLQEKNKALQLQVSQLSEMKEQQYELLQATMLKDRKH